MTGVLAGYEDARRRRAPLPPVRRDDRRLDRRVEPRGGPLTHAGRVGRGRCHPSGRGPRWCALAVRGPRSGRGADPEPLRRRWSGRRPARRTDPRARAAGLPEGRRSIAAFGDEVDRWGATFDGRRPVSPSTRATVAASRSAAGRRLRLQSGRRLRRPARSRRSSTPVRIGDRRYVDGGAWSPTNADAAPAGRRDRVLLLEPTAALVRGALRGAALLEAVALHSRGAVVKIVIPDDSARPLMGRRSPRSRRAYPGGGLSARRC